MVVLSISIKSCNKLSLLMKELSLCQYRSTIFTTIPMLQQTRLFLAFNESLFLDSNLIHSHTHTKYKFGVRSQ